MSVPAAACTAQARGRLWTPHAAAAAAVGFCHRLWLNALLGFIFFCLFCILQRTVFPQHYRFRLVGAWHSHPPGVTDKVWLGVAAACVGMRAADETVTYCNIVPLSRHCCCVVCALAGVKVSHCETSELANEGAVLPLVSSSTSRVQCKHG